MTVVETFVILLAVGFVAAFVAGFAQTPPDPIRQAKERFIALSRLGRPQAEAELRDRLEALAERFPGKSTLWYLQWLVTDLERSKR